MNDGRFQLIGSRELDLKRHRRPREPDKQQPPDDARDLRRYRPVTAGSFYHRCSRNIAMPLLFLCRMPTATHVLSKFEKMALKYRVFASGPEITTAVAGRECCVNGNHHIDHRVLVTLVNATAGARSAAGRQL